MAKMYLLHAGLFLTALVGLNASVVEPPKDAAPAPHPYAERAYAYAEQGYPEASYPNAYYDPRVRQTAGEEPGLLSQRQPQAGFRPVRPPVGQQGPSELPRVAASPMGDNRFLDRLIQYRRDDGEVGNVTIQSNSSGRSRFPPEPANDPNLAGPAPRRRPAPMAPSPEGVPMLRMAINPGRADTNTAEHPAGPPLVVTIDGPQELSLGQQAQYIVTVGNQSGVEFDEIALQTELPPFVRVVDVDTPFDVNGAWVIGRLPAGSARSFKLRVVCDRAGVFDFNTRLIATQVNKLKIEVLEPKLEVEVYGSNSFVPGRKAKFVLAVRNSGRGTAHDVQIQQSIPDVLNTEHGRQLVIEVGTLAAGAHKQVEIPVDVLTIGTGVTHVMVTAAGGIQTEAKAEVVVQGPKLKLHVKGPEIHYQGRVGQYAARMVNEGELPVEGLTLITSLPDTLTLVDADQGAQIDSAMHLLGWEIGTLAPGETKTVRWWAVSTDPGPVNLDLVAEASNNIREEGRITTTVEAGFDVMLELLDVVDPVESGNEAVYRVRLYNRGPQIAENLQLTALYDNGLQPVASQWSEAETVTERGIVFPVIPKLEPGQMRTYQFRGRALQPGERKITVQLTAGSKQEVIAERVETTQFRDRLGARLGARFR